MVGATDHRPYGYTGKHPGLVEGQSYRYAARARAAQQSAACGLLDRVTGKRVVGSLDGGRARVRRKKRGPKTHWTRR